LDFDGIIESLLVGQRNPHAKRRIERSAQDRNNLAAHRRRLGKREPMELLLVYFPTGFASVLFGNDAMRRRHLDHGF
jgi:hypothetical protein